ncbi:hypothetical protein K438DRAFT_1926164 [Mycena galopus ATCC 62051]|nr:hypothetical protein K438DRAFT_1926164 [Mycena galopus ATCC 62051]
MTEEVCGGANIQPNLESRPTVNSAYDVAADALMRPSKKSASCFKGLDMSDSAGRTTWQKSGLFLLDQIRARRKNQARIRKTSGTTRVLNVTEFEKGAVSHQFHDGEMKASTDSDKNGISGNRALVVDLDAKILDLERSLFALQSEKSRLDSFKYPVLTLPDEIAGAAEIFIHFLPLYPDPIRSQHLLRPTHPPVSECCPLSVEFQSQEDRGVLEIMSALVPHRPRWEYLDLALFASDISAIDGPMPPLRRVDLTVRHVTSFSATWVSVSTGALPAICRPTTIELPCLETFSLRNEDVPDAAGYLDDFRVPALRCLRLEGSFLGREPTQALASFISKSSCTLQQVCFTRVLRSGVASYREAFSSIHWFSSDDDSDATSIPAHSPY